MNPMQEDEYLLKMVMKNGHCISLISGLDCLTELVSHPKWMKMRDGYNDIYISVEDVLAFEITNNRAPEPKTDDEQQATPPSA